MNNKYTKVVSVFDDIRTKLNQIRISPRANDNQSEAIKTLTSVIKDLIDIIENTY